MMRSLDKYSSAYVYTVQQKYFFVSSPKKNVYVAAVVIIMNLKSI